MEAAPDIRWMQRYANYNKALARLTEKVNYIHNNTNTDAVLANIVQESIIQSFEYTFELAWNTMKDFLIYKGLNDIVGSRDALRYALQNSIIANGTVWMDMLASRNKTTHTYDDDTARDIYDKIIMDYYPVFLDFKSTMNAKLNNA